MAKAAADSVTMKKSVRQQNQRNSSSLSNPVETGSEKRPERTNKGYERHRVKHNYHDYAGVFDVPEHLEIQVEPKASGGVSNPFPMVLHKLLTESERMGFSDVISWQPHGRAFLIHNPQEFIKTVVPLYFKHSKLSSFQRQLSLYGFVRLTNEGPSKGAYYHELFLRGRPFLCSKIQRTRVKGTWVRTSSSPESEPDFFSMPPVMDIPSTKSELLGSTNEGTTGTSTSTAAQVSIGGEEEELRLPTQLYGELNACVDRMESSTRSQSSRNPPAMERTVIQPQGLAIGSLPVLSAVDYRELEKSHDPFWNQIAAPSGVPSLITLDKRRPFASFLDQDGDFELNTFLQDVDLGNELEMAEEILQRAFV